MTEEQWLAGTNLPPLLTAVRDERKLRLFGVAISRLLARWITLPRARKALDAAERYADGEITYDTLRRWAREVRLSEQSTGVRPRPHGTPDPEWLAHMAAGYITYPNQAQVWPSAVEILLSRPEQHFGSWAPQLRPRLKEFLHEIFGNPFRPIPFLPEWRTDTALTLARQMYDSRDFSAMPILADALQDAGCDSDDILSHCRGAGATHVRGCWAVDLVLGKA
jgi:hypothetical protein